MPSTFQVQNFVDFMKDGRYNGFTTIIAGDANMGMYSQLPINEAMTRLVNEPGVTIVDYPDD